MLPENNPNLRVTDIGEFIRHHSCERRFKLGFNNRAEAGRFPLLVRSFNAIDPVLQASGDLRENQWEEALRNAEFIPVNELIEINDDNPLTLDRVFEVLERLEIGQNAFSREVSIIGTINDFDVVGRIDFLLLRWEEDIPYIWIIEGKASRKDRTYHRVQVATYLMLFEQYLGERDLLLGGITFELQNTKCSIVRVDEMTNQPQNILELEPLGDLDREFSDIRRLLSESGTLRRILNTDIDELDYRLDQKCDGCVFNSICFPESARQRRLELIGIDPSTIRILRNSGIATIDDLANIDLASDLAISIQNNPNFNDRLDYLRQLAQSRRTNLPGERYLEDFPITPLRYSPQSQLPEHEINGRRIIRIFLNVDYDYIENRVVALSAHITNSNGNIVTENLNDEDGNWIDYDPEIREELEDGSYQEVIGLNVIEFLPSEWGGVYEFDSVAERQLIQNFFRRLINAISRVSVNPEEIIHFYVWSRSEMTHLIEACSRVDTRLLSSLRELLGCRESLEQLIFSCLEQEVDNKYTTGWTSKGLVVTSSLSWFGKRYHWRRRVSNQEVRLDQLFTQDIFDFKTDLYLNADGQWATNEQQESGSRFKFEVRSRFYDSITAPYWYAYWGSDLLPDPNDINLPPQVRAAIRRYQNAIQNPLYMEEYLQARVHALRWIEERIRFKNPDIQKQPITISNLPAFDLEIDSTAQSAIDFLRLDQQVKTTDWLSKCMAPIASRVPSGETLPLRDVVSNGSIEGEIIIEGRINIDQYFIDLDYLSARSKIRDGSFVRLSVCSDDPNQGQSIRQLINGGVTCIVQQINWDDGSVRLTALPARPSRYILPYGGGFLDAGIFFNGFATLDENVSDFVAGTVEDRLLDVPESHVYNWLNPLNPDIPEVENLDSEIISQTQNILENLQIREGLSLEENQITAIIEGINSRIQLIQGPPGTGKTLTTSIAILCRILLFHQPGDLIVIGANTHTAVDNLLERLYLSINTFRDNLPENFQLPYIQVSKVHSSRRQILTNASLDGITDFSANPSKTIVRNLRRDSVLVIGGTTNGLLKLARELPGADLPNGLLSSLLVIDESSMMVFPHFLALSTIVEQNGRILLAGDHRQLAPIVAHDWEREDRPPVMLYQPYVSAYQAIDSLTTNNPRLEGNAISRSALRFTFRLPTAIRELVARLYRIYDDIELLGIDAPDNFMFTGEDSWDQVWEGDNGLFLVLHSERESRQINNLELEIIQQILGANENIPENSIGIVTPYRAQRSLLQQNIGEGEGNSVDVIDTVERLQGDQRPTIIVSAVASDPSAISENAEFILNLNRSNVAFSRSQNRLIVVCSEELINHIPVELENYDSSMLWKALRSICSLQLAQIELNGEVVRIFTVPRPNIINQ